MKGAAGRGGGVVWARRLAALAFFLGGGGLVTALSTAAVWRESRPDLALRVWPWDTRAMAASAEQDLQAGGGTNIPPKTVGVLETALLRDATAVNAWRTLGIAAYSRARADGVRYLLISQSLSARDLLTQIWLIEDSARRGDLDDALQHYDVALRTSAGSADLLLPALVAATKEPLVSRKVAALLGQDPPWAANFTEHFSQNPPTSWAATQLIAALPRDSRAKHLNSFRRLIPLSIERGDYEQAAAMYSLLSGRRAGGISDTRFAGESAFPPFDWDLTDTPELRAERVPRAEGDSKGGLRVFAANGAIASVARQLVNLAPATYRLRSRTGPQSERAVDRLLWRMTCAESGRSLVELDATPREPTARSTEQVFSVPRNCGAQWLSLEVTAPETPGGAEAWVESIDVLSTRAEGT